MLENLEYILQHRCLLDRKYPLIVGVSGGTDSLFLLEVLHRAGYQPVVVYFNHGLRPEADEEEKIVQRFAEGKNLEFHSLKGDVREVAHRRHLSIEEAARELRYTYLFSVADAIKAQAVAVGHTADDQVETVWMHLLRGSGLNGLRGMPYRSLPNAWSSVIPLVRPLLGVWREEIAACLEERGLSPVTDQSNLDKTYFRNRLRHDLIPYLQNYNPAIQDVILRMSNIIAGDVEVIEQALENSWQEVCVQQAEKFVQINIEAFREQLIGIQRRILRRAISALRSGLRDIDYDAIERAINYLEMRRSGKIDLGAGVYCWVDGESFFVAAQDSDLPLPDLPQVQSSTGLSLEVPGTCDLGGTWRITARWVDLDSRAMEVIKETSSSTIAWLDAGSLILPLRVRGRTPGDHLAPYGMAGHQVKVSDVMVNLKIPARARARWPIVLSGQDLVWIPGFRISEGYQVRESSSQAVKIELKREEQSSDRGML